jgi:hypothetical protein
LGNFLVIVAASKAEAEGERIFRAGLANAQRIKGSKPNGIVQTNWVKAASFARLNGSGSSIAVDPKTNSWLLVAGTWFHSGGYASGDEQRLLARMIEAGADRAARELEGFFAIVFGDSIAREVFVIIDPVGSRHCFVRAIGEVEVISTSSLLAASLAGCTLDRAGCEEFLRTGVIYENRTFFNEVRKIAPARIARYSESGLANVGRYWSMSQLDPERFDGRQAVRELSEKLVDAVRKAGKLFSHPVCDLTGGYDSRAVAAAFLAAGADFETTVAGPADSPDVIVSKGLAKLTGRPHHHIESDGRVSLEHLSQSLRLTDGGYDLVDYARILSVHRRLSSVFDASINGSFGELARGYWWETLRPEVGRRKPIDSRALAVGRYVVDPSSPRLYTPSDDARFIDRFAQVISRANLEFEGWPNTAQMDNAYLDLRMQHWQGRIASSTDQNWPCLSPFMMRSVLETMLQISFRLRYRSLLARKTIAALQPAIAAYPLEHGYPALPLSWSNWPRFLPGLKVLAKKSGIKIAGRMFKGKMMGARRSGIEPARLQLWREPEVNEIFDPGKMQLSELIAVERLRDFLDASRQPYFGYDQQWNRILSLEMALREVKAMSHE